MLKVFWIIDGMVFLTRWGERTPFFSTQIWCFRTFQIFCAAPEKVNWHMVWKDHGKNPLVFIVLVKSFRPTNTIDAKMEPDTVPKRWTLKFGSPNHSTHHHNFHMNMFINEFNYIGWNSKALLISWKLTKSYRSPQLTLNTSTLSNTDRQYPQVCAAVLIRTVDPPPNLSCTH